MKKILLTVLAVCLLAGCTGKKETSVPSAKPEETADPTYQIDYLVLVNKLHQLPDDWETNLKTEHFTNTVGDDVEVEVNAYKAYLELKEELAKEDIYVDLDNARRSVAVQQEIMDEFTKEYGADYAAKIVAKPGYSEHHTGLALDLYLIIDGKDVVLNEEMMQHPEIWTKIHAKLADHGFILRYLPDKEHITGYAYEPWHIRYIGDTEKAKEIMSKGMTLEGWLGEAEETNPDIILGSSEAYSDEERQEMAVLIKCQFAAWKGCQLQNIRYAGDLAEEEEILKWLNENNPDCGFVKAAEFLMDFHSPKEDSGSLNPDQDYKDYQWWLGCDEEGSWQIAGFGY